MTRHGRLQLAVGLHGDAAAQVVEHQGLVRLRKPQLPGQTACLILVCGEAPVPPSWPLIKTTSAWPFATRGNGPDADFRDELYANTRVMIGVLEIVNQLRQIFDGVDVMVRRW